MGDLKIEKKWNLQAIQSELKCKAKVTSGGLLWKWPGKALDTDTVQSPEHGLHNPLLRHWHRRKDHSKQRADWTTCHSARTLTGPFIRWPGWGARRGQNLQFTVSGKQQGSSSLPLELLRHTSFPRKKNKPMSPWLSEWRVKRCKTRFVQDSQTDQVKTCLHTAATPGASGEHSIVL